MAGNDAIASHYERWTIPPHVRLMKVVQSPFANFHHNEYFLYQGSGLQSQYYSAKKKYTTHRIGYASSNFGCRVRTW